LRINLKPPFLFLKPSGFFVLISTLDKRVIIYKIEYMAITDRQEKLLDRIVKEYINSALPVSSQLLNEKYSFGISPATLRIEMQKLTDEGFLRQPHTSAGRVPTDKGYRFFVDKLFEKGFADFNDRRSSQLLQEIEKEMENSLRFVQRATKVLAENSSNLGLSYLLDENILWKEGWKEIFDEPEFKEAEFAIRFAKMLDSFEKNIDKVASDFPIETKVFIGRENPAFRNRDFSVVTAKFELPELGYQGVFAILGPKRMNYNKNISLINFLTQSLRWRKKKILRKN